MTINKKLIPRNSSIVIGLSGGPDSVFLLHHLAAFLQNGHIKTLIAAHLDHEWRDDSYKDVDFCRKITKKYRVPLVDAKISNLSISIKFNGSKEEFGRIARRHFFETICKKNNMDFITLAHHAQDQQETFFIRLLRGASISGLAAMKPIHDIYIRPLLDINKSDILSFLDKNNIAYLTDPSNTSSQFLRNRIRNNVLPALRTSDNRFDKKFKETLSNLQEVDLFLEQEAKKQFNRISEKTETGYVIVAHQLLHLDPVLCKRVLVHWLCLEKVQFPVSSGFFAEVLRFLQQPHGGTHNLCPNWSMVKKRGYAYLVK